MYADGTCTTTVLYMTTYSVQQQCRVQQEHCVVRILCFRTVNGMDWWLHWWTRRQTWSSPHSRSVSISQCHEILFDGQIYSAVPGSSQVSCVRRFAFSTSYNLCLLQPGLVPPVVSVSWKGLFKQPSSRACQSWRKKRKKFFCNDTICFDLLYGC